MTVIGLLGHAGAGKDTAADRLINYHEFSRFTLADKVREAALALDPLIVLTENVENGKSREVYRLTDVVSRLGWHDAKAIPEVRRTLQRLGTEAGWKLHGSTLWTKHAENAVAESQNPLVITDLRMPHEIAWLRSVSGILVAVRRDKGAHQLGENAEHASEKSIDELMTTADHTINNNSSIAELFTKVDTFAQSL